LSADDSIISVESPEPKSEAKRFVKYAKDKGGSASDVKYTISLQKGAREKSQRHGNNNLQLKQEPYGQSDENYDDHDSGYWKMSAENGRQRFSEEDYEDHSRPKEEDYPDPGFLPNHEDYEDAFAMAKPSKNSKNPYVKPKTKPVGDLPHSDYETRSQEYSSEAEESDQYNPPTLIVPSVNRHYERTHAQFAKNHHRYQNSYQPNNPPYKLRPPPPGQQMIYSRERY